MLCKRKLGRASIWTVHDTILGRNFGLSESQVSVFHMSPAHQGLRRDTIT